MVLCYSSSRNIGRRPEGSEELSYAYILKTFQTEKSKRKGPEARSSEDGVAKVEEARIRAKPER